MHDPDYDHDLAVAACEHNYDEAAQLTGLGMLIGAPEFPVVGALAAYGVHVQGLINCDDTPRPDMETPSYIGGKIGHDPHHDPAPPEPPSEAPGTHGSLLDDRVELDQGPGFNFETAQDDNGGGFDFGAAEAGYDSAVGSGDPGAAGAGDGA